MLDGGDGTVPYIVLVLAGLEEYSKAILSAHLNTSVRRVLHPPASDQWAKPPPEPADLIFAGKAGMAVKLLFFLPRPRSDEEWAAQHSMLASLPCTIGLLAPLALVSAIPLAAEEGLARIELVAASISDATWDAAVCTWRGCRAVPMAADAPPPRSFRASGLRDGKHGFHSPQLAQSVGAGILSSGRALTVDLERFELDVAALLVQGELLLGLNLWHGAKGAFKARLGPEPRPLLPYLDAGASLRSSTAHMMLHLARVDLGDVILDPMCGVGTLPLVGAAATDCAFALAGDVDPHVVAQTALNAAALSAARLRASRAGSAQLLFECDAPPAYLPGWHAEQRRIPRRPAGGGGVLTCLWSAACLPLRTASVDVAAVDLPFGIAHKVDGFKGGLRALYAQSFAELARVVRPGGRLVGLATSRRTLEAPLATLGAFWDPQRALHVNCGGAFAWIVLWVRTDVPWPAPGGAEAAALASADRPTPQVKLGGKESLRRKQGGARNAPPRPQVRANVRSNKQPELQPHHRNPDKSDFAVGVAAPVTAGIMNRKALVAVGVATVTLMCLAHGLVRRARS